MVESESIVLNLCEFLHGSRSGVSSLVGYAVRLVVLLYTEEFG